MGTTMFTAKDVQEIRQRTGAGMMDCKKALEETGGDKEKAVEYLRAKGIAKAEKRADRAASEGRIVSALSPDGRRGVLVELNSETDFVARNEDFGRLVNELARQLLEDESTDGVVTNASESAAYGRAVGGGASSIGDQVKEASGRIGENIVLRRYARFVGDGAVGSYIHHNGKVGVLVEVGGGTGEAATQLARQVAEHIAAGVPSVPLAVGREQVPADGLERERRIFAEQAAQSGKPENIVQKMVEGRVDKYYKEVTLLEQPWVRDDSKTIKDLVAESGKQAGATFTVRRFARFRMGEE